MTNPTPSPWISPFDPFFEDPTTLPVDTTPLTTLSGMYGTPDQDAKEFDGQQELPKDCAIAAQKFVLEQYTGQKVDEMQLVKEAEAHGWFDPNPTTGGTQFDNIGKELELHGIPVTHHDHATISDLESELAQGHKVMATVDCHALWGDQPATGEANHVVVISGIDTSDPNNPQVIVSDTGDGHAEDRYPLDKFMSAWQTNNSDCAMWATQQAPPSAAPAIVNPFYHGDPDPSMPFDQPAPFDHLQLPAWAPSLSWDPWASSFSMGHLSHLDTIPANNLGHASSGEDAYLHAVM